MIAKVDNKFFVDLTGDEFPNLIVVDKNKDGSSDYISLDRNGNQKIDAVIEIITVSDKNLSYRWFIDDNEDGIVELIANDADGDWIIEDMESHASSFPSFINIIRKLGYEF